ncbi:hypothetical protein HWV62_15563 [Athelia sp. TMB]|nr:hypothetical protein HWV62_15563 [Athelia sp. TMB]
MPRALSHDAAAESDWSRAKVLEIPQAMRNVLLPSPTLDVASFLARSWPQDIEKLVGHKPEKCFLKTIPSESGSCLLERNLPSKEFVDGALACLDQALRDGASSIIDPNYREGRLPLWCLSFWRECREVAAAWKAWSKSAKWLLQHETPIGTQPEITQSRRNLESLPWNEITKIKGAATNMRTIEFAKVLSNTLLTTTLVDVLVNIIASHVQSDGLLSETFEVVDLLFMHYIEKAESPESYQKRSCPYLHRLEKKLRAKQKILIYPLHIPKRVHFISSEVNFVERTISYGDSVPERQQKLPLALNKVQWWLSARFEGPFKSTGCSLDHRVQLDGHSCGICSPNMIAHRVGYDPLWTPTQAPYERAKWFNRLVAAHSISLGRATVDIHDEPRMAATAAPRAMAHLLNEHTIVAPSLSSTAETSPIYPSSPAPPINVDAYSDEDSVHGDAEHHDTVGESLDDDVDIPPVSEYASSSGYSESEAESIDERESSMLPEDVVELEAREKSHPRTPATETRATQMYGMTSSSTKVSGSKSSRIEDLLKRSIEEVEGSSGDEESDSESRAKCPRIDRPATASAARGVVGISNSTLATRALNKSVDNGTFVKSPTKWQTFITKIRELDEDAEFDIEGDPRKVRHSSCQRAQKMEEPYHINVFCRHVKTCSGPTKKVKQKMAPTGVPSVSTFFGKLSTPRSTLKPAAILTVPCPGLDSQNTPSLQRAKLEAYILRTPVAGAGGPSLDSLTKVMYPMREFTSLTDREKRDVRAAQRVRHRWRIFSDEHKVYASACSQDVRMRKGQKPVPPCSECEALLSDKSFKNALAVTTKPPENLKFTPKALASRATIEKYGRMSGLEAIIDAHEKNPRNPCILYAKNVLDGHYKDGAEEVFVQLVEAMVTKQDKIERGVGLQNFKYGPGLKELSHLIQIQSPRVYQSLRKIFPLPTARNLQANRAREPKFPIGIQERSFELVVEHLRKLDYDGPVGLACDDTKLTPAFRPYYDSTTKNHYLLGSTSKPMVLADPDQLSKAIEDGNLKKATKIRLWCLQVPLPGIPTIIVAGLGIDDSLSAEDLLELLIDILIDGLLARNIWVCNYAADGSATERKLQRLLAAMATGMRITHIRHPGKGRPPIALKIPLFGTTGQPVVMVQDSKHAAKTFRNNAFSGAKLLVLGNHVVHYHQFRLIAFGDGPLYRRDVEKMDRQDDGAATRLGSADTLDWLVKSDSPDLIGPVIYLFVFYELIDAYQSRTMKHIDRAHIALRALFFMEMWEEFLKTAGYPKGKHMLSPEACDITRTLIHGLLSLIVVYRDLDGVYPLLPWLLTTEVCEHVFGLCRQIVKDFTELDWLFMIPKLFIRLREHAFFGKFSDGKERASGYSHTYTDNRDVDLSVLSTYPSDDDLSDVAVPAYTEAESLWDLLGAAPSSHMPSVSSWFAESENHGSDAGADDSDDETSEDSCVGDWNAPAIAVSEVEEIQEYLDKMETFTLKSFQEEDAFNELALASISLNIADDVVIHELPEPTDDEKVAAYAEDRLTVSNSRRSVHLPPINMDTGSSRLDLSVNPSDAAQSHMISFEKLIALRRAHQTKQAATGTRKSASQADILPDDPKSVLSAKKLESQRSEKRRLIKEFAEVIKKYEVRGASTGTDRKNRWQGKPAAGNAANAADAAKLRSKKAMKKRANAYSKYGYGADFSHAGISSARELTHAGGDSSNASNEWGFVVFKEKVMLARILSIYKRTGDKNATHGWTPAVSAITSVSYLPVQVFEHHNGRIFRAVPQALYALQVKQFALLPSAFFVIVTDHTPSRVVHTENMQVSIADASQYHKLASAQQTINLVIKNINSRPRQGKEAESENEESDED